MTDEQIDDLLKQTLDSLCANRVVPSSTYRLQFHKGFTFRDATAIVPYLAKLGVTHCYASPYLKAAAGSTHGYDVVDHTLLNDELGNRAEYDAWVDAMTAARISHILDIVPNHMGVGTDENRLWNDVLEAGEQSLYARFFDIVWRDSPREELRGRVLLPMLGEPYGATLEAGKLRLEFDPMRGRFCLACNDRHLPLAVETYSIICGETDSMPSALRTLIESITPSQEAAAWAAERGRVQSSLASLAADETIGRHIDARLQALNGTAGNLASFDALDALLSRQHYRLAYWRTASDEINYRRFFDVTTLAALSMEREEVFEEAHALIFELLAAGKIAGLRVDHSDGLRDPKAYFVRLQRAFVVAHALHMLPAEERTRKAAFVRSRALQILTEDELTARRPLYVITEKILAPGEPLPKTWAMDGTSGYDVLNEINGLFIDASGTAALDACYRHFTGSTVAYTDLAIQKKRETLVNGFSGELNMLAHQLDRLAQRDRHSRDFTFDVLHDAIRETIANFSVYRPYVVGAASERDALVVEEAITSAIAGEPTVEACVFHFLRDVLLLRGVYGGKLLADAVAFVAKFQQLTSPVTAKGLEDTAFYIYHRLVSVNEVGGDPARVGVSPESLHNYFSERQHDWPGAMTVLSTHDTKRSEDVRARISVLSEIPDEWAREVGAWHALNHPVDIHPNDAYLLYQTLVGAWPVGEVDDVFVGRIIAYMNKAMREAKERTSWTAPNESVERAMESFIRRILDAGRGRAFREAFGPFQRRVAWIGASNALAQTLIRLTAPGVPDTYQGTELWDLSLVDPDNRRPVDYTLRERVLGEVDAAVSRDLTATGSDGRAKMLVTSRTLRLRRDHPGLFARGAYVPLNAAGPMAANVFAFARVENESAAIIVVPRLIASALDRNRRIDWGQTTLVVPPDLAKGRWNDAFSAQPAREWSLMSMLGGFPVALYFRGPG